MKIIILSVLTFLFLVLPSIFYNNATLFAIMVALWPIAAVLLAVLYNKWFDKILRIERNKDDYMGNKNKETDEIKD